MRIGLIDVDGHRFPNLALMRISAYHKAKGDTVEWWWSDFEHYDVVYMSKVFSDAYSKDVPEPLNADKVIKGGTGYAISLGSDGREHFDKENHADLPPEIELCFPDYSIYPQYRFAVSMTSRGCPRQCSFCHVAAKEGCKSYKCADVSAFWSGQKEIKVLDPNITACKDKRELFRQYLETGVWIDFTQGLDIRMINEDDLEDINRMKLSELHFAWDNPNDDLTAAFEKYTKLGKKTRHGRMATVYCLTNFEPVTTEEHIERALYRVYIIRELGLAPYVMVYDKPHAQKELVRLQSWCNNPKIFHSVPRFEDYDLRKRKKSENTEKLALNRRKQRTE